jgi:phage terminase large subunit-like protein
VRTSGGALRALLRMRTEWEAERSPDQLNALVWAVTALGFGAKDGPRVRAL